VTMFCFERESVPLQYPQREVRLLKGIAQGTYNTKHAEAARLYYTTILLFYYTTTLALNEGDRNDVHERVRA
jgi:hypothetical protein